MGVHVHFPCMTTSGFDLCRPCTCYHCLCEFFCALVLLCLEGIVYFVISIPMTLTIVFASSSAKFYDASGERFDGGLPFRTECAKVSHSLNIAQLWISIFGPYYCRRKLLIYGYSIWVMTYFFSKTTVFCFPLGPWHIQSQFLSTRALPGLNSSSWKEALNSVR